MLTKWCGVWIKKKKDFQHHAASYEIIKAVLTKQKWKQMLIKCKWRKNYFSFLENKK